MGGGQEGDKELLSGGPVPEGEIPSISFHKNIYDNDSGRFLKLVPAVDHRGCINFSDSAHDALLQLHF